MTSASHSLHGQRFVSPHSHPPPQLLPGSRVISTRYDLTTICRANQQAYFHTDGALPCCRRWARKMIWYRFHMAAVDEISVVWHAVTVCVCVRACRPPLYVDFVYMCGWPSCLFLTCHINFPSFFFLTYHIFSWIFGHFVHINKCILSSLKRTGIQNNSSSWVCWPNWNTTFPHLMSDWKNTFRNKHTACL